MLPVPAEEWFVSRQRHDAIVNIAHLVTKADHESLERAQIELAALRANDRSAVANFGLAWKD